MLVLSRKVGERILVPNSNLVVTVVSVKGHQVRLGVSAPADVAVYREEVWLQVSGETQRCAALPR
jgi:carbon storage regulator